MDHHQPVALITGGASGIGRAFAQHWIAAGGRAVIADLNAQHLAEAVSELGQDHARGAICDVTSSASVADAVAGILAVEGRIDTVFNSAGIARPEPSDRCTDAAFSLLLDIHVTGTMRVCREAFPALRESGGTIVNVASVAAFAGMPGRASYTSAKAAVGGLTRTLAVEWGTHGIRVNAVAPGYVRTALTDELLAAGKLNDAAILARTPVGRFARPAEIAAAAHFLATPQSSFVTGHTLVVDGGLTIDGDWY
ncbi:SDR family NAD(P)-dependent oxidoreductase [Leucobacter luti]|uniref:NAD(P)-dependent dehydrogenase (Short-subunit alcohol dehydrogenase family) n=1 Tax=Leucobacter luti TaxID=340320 RepID=A0A4V6PVP8_9MICO|nr:SDR family NAD(P)-dependent oxidoreductase [Leucobacter luti]QYM74934.1 SDR family oxidoreductase [Leucobacter luti]TDP93338.1 NAD(P)-dependent dehydrogenase (short-subunit alcohol dehydrogenase family) [Leucobacter luti]